MEVLVTGAAGGLGQALGRTLGKEHRLRLMDEVEFQAPEKTQVMQGSVLDPDDAWRAVRGVQAIVHTATPPPGLPLAGHEREQALLDWHTRGTHVLLRAAADAGVRTCVYAGTLEVFRSYPDDVYISEYWKPLPTPDMTEMGNYLGELVCREFARDFRMGNTSLRLGRLVHEESVAGQRPDLMWLDPRDAAQAFACALRQDMSEEVRGARRWRVLHVCADVPHPKYLIQRARAIGYSPEHNFAANWGGREM